MKTKNIMIVGVGGQGSLLASKLLGRILLDQVRRDNAASIRLHEKLGFETDGYGYRNQKGREVVLYLKPL